MHSMLTTSTPIFLSLLLSSIRLSGIARISRPAGSKDSAPPSPDRKISSRGPSNGTSTGKKISNGSTSGSVTGEKSAVGDKNRDRRRGAERKEGDRKDGDRPTRGPGGERERRDRGGRERDPANKVCRNLTVYYTVHSLNTALAPAPFIHPSIAPFPSTFLSLLSSQSFVLLPLPPFSLM
jgi:hypothetical protein